MIINTIKATQKALSSLAYMPHALVYGILPRDKKTEISIDWYANCSSLPQSAALTVPPPPPLNLCKLACLLSLNQYFRTLFFHRIKTLWIKRLLWGKKSGLEIPYDVEIGPGVILDHPFSTIINAKKIGVGLRIKNNVTIGNKNDDENLRPSLGDGVYIGAGAIVIGNITIGNNVVIGAGAVVTKNLPDNCVAAGNPAKIIKKCPIIKEFNL